MSTPPALHKLEIRCAECSQLLQGRMCVGVEPSRVVAHVCLRAPALACPYHPKAEYEFVLDDVPTEFTSPHGDVMVRCDKLLVGRRVRPNPPGRLLN